LIGVIFLLSANLWANPARVVAWAGIRVYQVMFSELQPDVCNYNPSCSRFARAAVEEHGLVGMLMASDRLLRCNPDAWRFLGVEYQLNRGKLREDPREYYLFNRPSYPREVVYPW